MHRLSEEKDGTAALSKASFAPRWMELPERGTPAMLPLIHWIAVRIGRSAARLLLYPIAFYFLLSAHAARRVSYQYLKRVRAEMEQMFFDDLTKSKEITMRQWFRRSWIERVKERLAERLKPQL